MIASRLTRYCVAVLAIAAVALLPMTADAYWRGGGGGWGWHGGGGWGWRGGGGWGWGGGGCCGFYFGVSPLYVAPPPYYYYPPYPAPAYAPPPYPGPQQPYAQDGSNQPPPPAQACYAGQWVCPLDRPTVSGNACSCTGSSGRVWGRAR